jgi:serine/threonine protein kinase
MNTANICPNCCEAELENGVCPNCSFTRSEHAEILHTLPVGKMLAERYFIGKVLNEGDIGITYIGYDTKLEHRVAIKEYFPMELVYRTPDTHNICSYSGHKEEDFKKGLESFLKEAKRIAEFAGEPAVVTINDSFRDNKTAYIVMEYIDGESLKTLLRHTGRIGEESALSLITPIIKTLAKMHKEYIIHRDIAPDNILIKRDGKAVLVGFNFDFAQELKKYDKSLGPLVRRSFSPEEQYDINRGREGTWTDVYSVCAVLYNMIEGEVPDDVMSRLIDKKHKINFTVPISARTKAAILHGLEISPKKRTQTMDALLEELTTEKVPSNKNFKTVAGIAAAAVVFVAGGIIIGNAVSPVINGLPAPDEILTSRAEDETVPATSVPKTAATTQTLTMLTTAEMTAETETSIALTVTAPPATTPTERGTDEPSAPGTPINLSVMSFTVEVPEMFNKYFETYPDRAEFIEIQPTVIATVDDMYEPALDEALTSNYPPDLYCVEEAFVLKYTQGEMSSYAAPYESLGIDVENGIAAADIAQYTVDLGTNLSGEVVGLGFQSTGGAFIYRSSLAIDTWGTDDPEEIADKIGPGWDKFLTAASDLKAHGFSIVSGDSDVWNVVEGSSVTGWVVDNKLNLPPERLDFFDISKILWDGNFHNETETWYEAWYSDMRGIGERPVFGFFGPAWFINYTLAPNCGGTEPGDGTFGDWRVCEPTAGYFWGGTWLLVPKDSPNKEAVGDFIEWVTLDTSDTGLQYLWANNLGDVTYEKDSVTSGVVMGKADGTLDFLNGQNMYEVYKPANDLVIGTNLTEYDYEINEFFLEAVLKYRTEEMTKDEAVAWFKKQVADNLEITVE